MNDELRGQISTKFIGLRTKTYSYLIDDSSGDRKARCTKNMSKRKLTYANYKNCLEATQLNNKLDYLEKKNSHR